MLSISPVADSEKYYRADNYYFDDGRASSRWLGRAADALGLKDEVAAKDYEAMVQGQLPGGVRLGRMKGGEWKHRPGWDLTFAAPKSVSIMAELVGDRRLIDAHDKAVEVALRWIEADYAVTRIRRGNKIEHEHTGNLAAAIYRHDISRAQDPHLHSHAIVMNATSDANGKWRSLESSYLWQDLAAKEGGLRYQQTLARLVTELGYRVTPRGNGTFEIEGVPKAVLDLLSKRTRALEAYLARQGLEREGTTPEQRNIAMQRTRPDKPPNVAPEEVRRAWREELAEKGFGIDDLARLQRDAKSRTATPSHEARVRARAAVHANAAIADAAESLVERSAIFSDGDLRERATVFSLGRTSAEDIDQAIRDAAHAGKLLFREAKRYVSPTKRFESTTGWTTPTAIRTESEMLELERSGRDWAGPAFERDEARDRIDAAVQASRQAGHDWNAGQREAAEGLLLTRHRVAALQGYAGTAKTTTVLAAYVGALSSQGHEITVMAPTHAAAEVLGDAVQQDGRTVQRHLIEQQRAPRSGRASAGTAAWIVDEASLLSARQTRDLLRAAERAEARVVLVGDVMQLGSVDAGRAFAQLQQAGMQTFVLDKIVRQQNPVLRQAVEAGLHADAKGMLAHLERGGGKVVAIGGRETGQGADAGWRARIARLADDYMTLTPDQRARTLVIDPSREGRDALNAHIRRRRRRQGELAGPELLVDVLVSRDLTRVEKRRSLSYSEGDVVRFQRDYGPRAEPVIRKGEVLTVMRTSPATGRVSLQAADGQRVDWQPANWTKVEAYRLEQRGLQAGDIMTFTRSDPAIGVKNGQMAEVKAVDSRTQQAVLESPGEPPMTIDLTRHRHWDHGYARTVHLAQGRTADRALIHLESWRANVVQMRSAYVAVSRGRLEAQVITDDAGRLQQALGARSGAKAAAMDLSALRAGQATVTAAQRAPAPPRGQTPSMTAKPPDLSMGR